MALKSWQSAWIRPPSHRSSASPEGIRFHFSPIPTLRRSGSTECCIPRAGEGGKDIARPAEFLVDAGGTIRWVNLTDDIRVRARPESVLAAIDRL